MRKKITIVTMGQSPADPKTHDVYRMLAQDCDVEMHGIIDGMSEEEIDMLAPQGSEMLIVSSLHTGREVRIAEHNAIRLVNERLIEAEKGGSVAALILCTGHFDIPDMRMPVFVPEKILFSLFRAMGVKRLGAIVPKPEQIAASEAYYSEFSPRIRAASPYGTREQIEAAAASFRNSDVDILMTDCMGFTEELGELIQAASGKQVFVPRVVVPALLKAIVS